MSDTGSGDEMKQVALGVNGDDMTVDEPPISALPPRVSVQEESQVEVSASPAFQCLDDLFQDGKLTGTKVALLKAKYTELHETLKSTRENELQLLQAAKQYTTDLERQMSELEKADDFPESSNSEVSKLRQQLLKHNNELAQADERQYQLEYKIECLQEEKRLVEREYARMPKQGEVEKKIEELKQLSGDLRKEIGQRKTEAKNLKEVLDNRKHEVSRQTKALNEQKEELEKLKSELVSINAQPGQIAKESDRYSRQKTEIDKKLKESNAEFKEFTSTLQLAQQKQTELGDEKFELDGEVDRQAAKLADMESDYQTLMKDYDYAKEREAVLMGDRATLDLNLRHINLEKKTAHDIHSRKAREKDRELRNLKKAELHSKVALDSLHHTQAIYDKVKGSVDMQPKDDGSQGNKKQDLQKEVEQTKRGLAQQNSLTAVETVKVEQSIAEEERLLYEQSDLRIEVVELTRLAAIKNDEREQKARDFMRAEMRYHVQKTMDKCLRKLRGRYGLKRFLRDGAHTVCEDKNRKHYKAAEIKNFDGIECEWPMFYCYLIIDSVYRGNMEKVEYWQNQLKPLLKSSNDGPVVPKYYYVEKENLEKERAEPGSQDRSPSGEGEGHNLFLWGQSVYIISQLLVEGLLNINELDPVRRYLPAAERPRPNARYSSFQRGSAEKSSPTDLVIQVVLIAESTRLQQMLATYGIQSQTPHQIEPIQIWPPSELVKAYEQLGVNKKLSLSGRPSRPIGGLGTAKIYRACGYTFVCYPLLFEVSDFYLSQDMEFVIDDVKSDLAFLGKCWKLAGRPTFCMLLREDNVRGNGTRHLFELLAQFKRGECDGIKVRLGRLQEFISSSCIEHLDFLQVGLQDETLFRPLHEKDMGKQFRSLSDIPHFVEIEDVDTWVNYQELQTHSTWELLRVYRETENMYCQAQVLQTLLNREGLYYRIDNSTVEEKLETLVRQAATQQKWALVRFGSSLLGKVVDSLAPSITAILVRGKQVTIGVYGREEEVIDKPLAPEEIKNILYNKCYTYDVTQAVLQQELVINIGRYISTNPEFFRGILKIRIGWIVQAMQLELTYMDEAPDCHMTGVSYTSPSQLKQLLLRVLKKTPPDHDYRSVIWNRQLDGALNRVPLGFYDRVWQILERTPAGLKVAGYQLPQQPTLSDMTEYELNFSLLVEQMLSKIVDPAYRTIIIESFMVVVTILERNPELTFQKTVDMDKLVHEGFEMFQKDRSLHNEMEKQDSMKLFYNTPANIKHGTTSYIARATMNLLLEGDISQAHNVSCSIS